MAKEKPQPKAHDRDVVLADLKTKLDMLDERLDNMDSVVSALVERVMSQPLNFGFTCPHCGRTTEIAVIGNAKPGVSKG